MKECNLQTKPVDESSTELSYGEKLMAARIQLVEALLWDLLISPDKESLTAYGEVLAIMLKERLQALESLSIGSKILSSIINNLCIKDIVGNGVTVSVFMKLTMQIYEMYLSGQSKGFAYDKEVIDLFVEQRSIVLMKIRELLPKKPKKSQEMQVFPLSETQKKTSSDKEPTDGEIMNLLDGEEEVHDKMNGWAWNTMQLDNLLAGMDSIVIIDLSNKGSFPEQFKEFRRAVECCKLYGPSASNTTLSASHKKIIESLNNKMSGTLLGVMVTKKTEGLTDKLKIVSQDRQWITLIRELNELKSLAFSVKSMLGCECAKTLCEIIDNCLKSYHDSTLSGNNHFARSLASRGSSA